jgi:hypothetical protein
MQAYVFVTGAYMSSDKTHDAVGRARGGLARARVLDPVTRSEIAKRAASARWGFRATHRGNFQQDFGIDVDCYVLDDSQKTAVISQRGMGQALGYGRESSGQQILRLTRASWLAPYIGAGLTRKLENPLVFQGPKVGLNLDIHGYDVTVLIDVCQAIIRAESDGRPLRRQERLAHQAHIIVGASAKSGIKNLVYSLAGYNPSAEEVIAAFKLYVQEEARKYEPEFPSELYMQWHRLYDIPVLERGRSWHFKYLTVRHIYHPLAKSNGKLLALLRALKSKDGDRQKKLFQFLNDIGARALRMHLGRVLEMAESSGDQSEYERKIAARFGGQQELDLVIPSLSISSPPPSEQFQPSAPG